MKKNISTLLLLLLVAMTVQAQKHSPIVDRSKESITFVVDENLPAPNTEHLYYHSGTKIAQFILRDEEIPVEDYKIIASSFADDRLINSTKDAFYQCILQAYANHYPVALSPDMVWLIISQGFARYVNAHSEEVRDRLVGHTGKIDLVVESEQELLSEKADWSKILDGFASQIEKHTKKGIAKTMTADFSTTSQAERLASEITLMESVQSYFKYVVLYASCGIPTITLKGTPKDWQHVLDKTRKLKGYDMDGWIEDLEPILTEFVQAAKWNPNQAFWQSIIKKERLNELQGGGCSNEKPTEIDGWLLKLFPDESGKTLDKTPYTHDMPTERVRVSFKYLQVDAITGEVVSETPMELWAGFVGYEVDSITYTITPKIGWFARAADKDEAILQDLRERDKNLGISIRVKEVPEILAKLKHIRRLNLRFTGAVVLPDWMDQLIIQEFSISGKLSEQEKEAIRKRFPQVKFT